jgi:hypothetical protein
MMLMFPSVGCCAPNENEQRQNCHCGENSEMVWLAACSTASEGVPTTILPGYSLPQKQPQE